MVALIGFLGILLINPFGIVDQFNNLMPDWEMLDNPWSFPIGAGLIMIMSAILDPKIFGLGGHEEARRYEDDEDEKHL
jgi:hypothetical protein